MCQRLVLIHQTSPTMLGFRWGRNCLKSSELFHGLQSRTSCIGLQAAFQFWRRNEVDTYPPLVWTAWAPLAPLLNFPGVYLTELLSSNTHVQVLGCQQHRPLKAAGTVHTPLHQVLRCRLSAPYNCTGDDLEAFSAPTFLLPIVTISPVPHSWHRLFPFTSFFPAGLVALLR